MILEIVERDKYHQNTQEHAASPLKTNSINRWNVGRAFFNPIAVTLYCQSPLPIEKAVFSLSCGSNSTCQYPEDKSKQLKNVDPDN